MIDVVDEEVLTETSDSTPGVHGMEGACRDDTRLGSPRIVGTFACIRAGADDSRRGDRERVEYPARLNDDVGTTSDD